MPASRLTAFQQEVLREFFRREDRFFLTGGGALAGFHLGHRETLDLDLFTTTATIDEASQTLAALVFERVPQLIQDKPVVAGIRVDPPAEILANKLCTLLSRAELRDLVDVWALEEAGYRMEDALPAAAQKDGGLTPAQLAWVLSEVRIGDDAKPPGGVDVETLRAYLASLVARLTALARPPI